MKIRLNYEPVAKGRPKTAFTNGIIRTYTPSRTKKAQDAIRKDIEAKLSAADIKPFPAKIPLKLVVTFYRCKSMWLPKYVDMPYIKPDLDNFLKLLQDALNGTLIPDDAQITTLLVKKRWTKSSQALSRKKKRTGRNRGYIVCEIKEEKGNELHC